jgi:amidase
MTEHDPSRRDFLLGLAAAPLLQKGAAVESADSVCFMSAVEMARLIRSKKLSAREALAAHLKQIERVNPKVNAIVTLVKDMAEDAAVKADEMQARKGTLGPLHGLPVAHKDLFETREILTTYGSPIYRNNVPTEDDLVVARMRRAGAILVGKTNTPEFGAGSQTFNKVFGATLNPYDLAKTCGGSSGGAAVALACGLVPVASGSDTGGSLRNPAAFCNIAGFRPSARRVPNPKAALAWLTLNTAGCMGRSVADLAFALSTIVGPDRRAPLSINEPESASRVHSIAISKAFAWRGSGISTVHLSTRASAAWWMLIGRRSNLSDVSWSRRSRTLLLRKSHSGCFAPGTVRRRIEFVCRNIPKLSRTH